MDLDLKAGGVSDSVSARIETELEHAVHTAYPETEAHAPLEKRKGTIPYGIREEIEESARKQEENPKKKRLTMHGVKNATPGDGDHELDKCLDDIRPKSFTLDLKPSDCTTPDLVRTGVLERYGELQVQTGAKLESQWESKYFSQVLPFVIPRMVSGPDFRPEDKWRRHANTPVATPQEFNRGMARRVEGQIRNDATALPIIRSVCYKWAVEHAANLVVPCMGQRDRPGSVIAT